MRVMLQPEPKNGGPHIEVGKPHDPRDASHTLLTACIAESRDRIAVFHGTVDEPGRTEHLTDDEAEELADAIMEMVWTVRGEDTE